MEGNLNRRAFIKGLAFAGAAGAMTAGAGVLSACAPVSDEGDTLAQASSGDQVWDAEYDVVVVGFGGAGAVAAKTAADEGARVLLVEKAPEAEAGGNSKVCSQMVIYGHDDEQATYDYYKALAGEFPIDEEVLQVYTQGIAHIWDRFAEAYDLNKSDFVEYEYPEEYPEYPGAEAMNMTMLHDGQADGYIYKIESDAVRARAEAIDIWFDSPAQELVCDEATGAVVGVVVGRNGKPVRVGAAGGVVLACGGYENNPEMVRDYLGMTNYAFCGTDHNTGDGIKLALGAGADLWHMHCYESMGMLGGVGYKAEIPERSEYFFIPVLYAGSVILVGSAGYRYLREDEGPRHGHIYDNGVWNPVHHPHKSFIVFDQAQYDAIVSSGTVDETRLGQIVSAPSVEELGRLLGTEDGVLSQTVAEFNAMVAAGCDYAFHRAPETMRALSEEGPFYALELTPNILNTQGGPRRNAQAQVVSVSGKPIEGLYAAGECGGVTVNQYQGGGNMADNLIFGQIAGKNAALAAQSRQQA